MEEQTLENADESFLTSGEAARILHVSSKTLDRWADQGRVPCSVTLGGHRRFSRPAISAVAEQMASKSVMAHQD